MKGCEASMPICPAATTTTTTERMTTPTSTTKAWSQNQTVMEPCTVDQEPPKADPEEPKAEDLEKSLDKLEGTKKDAYAASAQKTKLEDELEKAKDETEKAMDTYDKLNQKLEEGHEVTAELQAAKEELQKARHKQDLIADDLKKAEHESLELQDNAEKLQSQFQNSKSGLSVKDKQQLLDELVDKAGELKMAIEKSMANEAQLNDEIIKVMQKEGQPASGDDQNETMAMKESMLKFQLEKQMKSTAALKDQLEEIEAKLNAARADLPEGSLKDPSTTEELKDSTTISAAAKPTTTQMGSWEIDGAVKMAAPVRNKSITAEDKLSLVRLSEKIDSALQGLLADATRHWDKLKEDVSQRGFSKDVADQLIKEISYVEIEAMKKAVESGYDNLKEEFKLAPGARDLQLQQILTRSNEVHEKAKEVMESKMEAAKTWIHNDAALNTSAAAQIVKDIEAIETEVMTSESSRWRQLLQDLGTAADSWQVALGMQFAKVDKTEQESVNLLTMRWDKLKATLNATEMDHHGRQNLLSRTESVKKGLVKNLKATFPMLKTSMQTLLTQANATSAELEEALSQVDEERKTMLVQHLAEWESMKTWLMKTPAVAQDKLDEFMTAAIDTQKDAMVILDEGWDDLMQALADCANKKLTTHTVAPPILPDASLADNSQSENAEPADTQFALSKKNQQSANLAELKQASHESSVRRHTFAASMESDADAQDEKNRSSFANLNILLLLVVLGYGLA